MPDAGHLDTRQVAERYQVVPETVRRWRSQGTGPPFVRVTDRTIRYDLRELERWERDQRDDQ